MNRQYPIKNDFLPELRFIVCFVIIYTTAEIIETKSTGVRGTQLGMFREKRLN